TRDTLTVGAMSGTAPATPGRPSRQRGGKIGKNRPDPHTPAYERPRGILGRLDHDIEPVEKPDNGRQREPRLFDPVDGRIDGIVESRAEIGFLQDRIVELGIAEIAAIKDHTREVTAGKIRFMQGTLAEHHLLELRLVKGHVVQRTSFERELTAEGITVLKMKPQHLTILELHIPEDRRLQIRHAQVAAGKNAFHEQDTPQVGA